MSDLTQTGRQLLASQPFSCLLGAELTALTERIAELRLAMRDELCQQHGFAHGGVVSYLADNALTFAGGAAFGGAGALTSEYKINYLRPATGDTLIARAEVVGLGKTQAVVKCEIFTTVDGVEKLCAVAQGTIAQIAK